MYQVLHDLILFSPNSLNLWRIYLKLTLLSLSLISFIFRAYKREFSSKREKSMTQPATFNFHLNETTFIVGVSIRVPFDPFPPTVPKATHTGNASELSAKV